MSIIIESRQFDDTMIGWQFDQICASNMSNAHKLPVLVYIQVESSLFPLRHWQNRYSISIAALIHIWTSLLMNLNLNIIWRTHDMNHIQNVLIFIKLSQTLSLLTYNFECETIIFECLNEQKVEDVEWAVRSHSRSFYLWKQILRENVLWCSNAHSS